RSADVVRNDCLVRELRDEWRVGAAADLDELAVPRTGEAPQIRGRYAGRVDLERNRWRLPSAHETRDRTGEIGLADYVRDRCVVGHGRVGATALLSRSGEERGIVGALLARREEMGRIEACAARAQRFEHLPLPATGIRRWCRRVVAR